MSILENNTLWIKEARLSFPHLLVAKPVNKGTPKFSCNFILDQNSTEWAEAMQIVGQMASEKWAEKAQGVLNLISSDKRLRCYGTGAEKISTQTGEIYEGYTDPGTVFLAASNDSAPKLYGQDAQPLPPTANANQMFVGGNYVAGLMSFWLQENEHGRAVRSNLIAVQYLREGEHFGADEIDAASVFQAVPGAPAAPAAAPGMPGAAPAPAAPAPLPGAAPRIDDFL